ncbi:MAG: DUF5666 domain-containing protein [Holophaga sp.]|nr:DUF5666 domain-containing protein [Holophaga sp.]
MVSWAKLSAPVLAALLTLACGGGAGGSLRSPGGGGSSSGQTGTVALSVRDASTEDWAAIGVKLLRVALIPEGGDAFNAVTVYTAPTPVPVFNLAQLDQLSEMLGNRTAPAGTYPAAVLFFSVNPGDVTLVSAADPSPDFPGATSTPYPASQIQIQTQGSTGTLGGMTLPVTVPFTSWLVVSPGQTSLLDLELDLSHPGFIVDHMASGDTAPFWAVDFNAPVVHQNPAAATDLVLRHCYGTVSAVAADHSAVTVSKDYPTWPAASPETAQVSNQSLTFLADTASGTLFTDLDAGTSAGITDFSTVAGRLANGEFLRIAARYQPDGTLVAARIWASSTFNKVFAGPEGHVLHVNGAAATPNFVVQDEKGAAVTVNVTAGTQFYFRNPADGVKDAASIQGASGISFLTGGNLVRGFKVHVDPVDPAATPLVARTVDIEAARFDGAISSASATSFTYARTFSTGADGYTRQLGYISASSPNGRNPQTGTAIQGYKWWNFVSPAQVQAFPTTAFANSVGNHADFGGTIGSLYPWGASYATWSDPAAASAWSARYTVLEPLRLPVGTVASPWVSASNSFGLALSGAGQDVTVNLDFTTGDATLVYQVDRTGTTVTVSPIDVTTSAGQSELEDTFLQDGSLVNVLGLPQADGSLKAYALYVYSGTLPQ